MMDSALKLSNSSHMNLNNTQRKKKKVLCAYRSNWQFTVKIFCLRVVL